MQTSANGFERIMDEVLNQKRRLEDLEAENQELRRQLADLREGRGIFVEILGSRFALVGEPVAVSPELLSAPATPLPALPAGEQSRVNIESIPVTADPETPLPGTDIGSMREEKAPAFTPEFLKELLLNEVSAAATGPVAALSDAEDTRSSTGTTTGRSILIDEEAKASLRRELMGSFLLE